MFTKLYIYDIISTNNFKKNNINVRKKIRNKERVRWVSKGYL
ncbi:hypothetical protein CLOSBL3_10645 [Clostridiaceae bacterium BL-3]|nr:hypothetical protein CLOSBL3_10645 [Clostridiaceae bacterium BL-3]